MGLLSSFAKVTLLKKLWDAFSNRSGSRRR